MNADEKLGNIEVLKNGNINLEIQGTKSVSIISSIIPESQIPEVIDFITYLKVKKDNQIFKELETASESSMGFWNNDKDVEVWNNA